MLHRLHGPFWNTGEVRVMGISEHHGCKQAQSSWCRQGLGCMPSMNRFIGRNPFLCCVQTRWCHIRTCKIWSRALAEWWTMRSHLVYGIDLMLLLPQMALPFSSVGKAFLVNYIEGNPSYRRERRNLRSLPQLWKWGCFFLSEIQTHWRASLGLWNHFPSQTSSSEWAIKELYVLR